MRNIPLVVLVISLSVMTGSCLSDKRYEEEEKSQIDNFLFAGDISADPDARGLYYIEVAEGSGEQVEKGDTVSVYYTGWFLDGTEMASNRDEETPFKFDVGNIGIIEGWNRGLLCMKGGGKAQLIVPSGLAYGPAGFGSFDFFGRYTVIIPSYTPLFYEIEIVKHVRGPDKTGIF